MTDAVSDSRAAPPATDLHCPLCGYSLIGLPEPRCPECGYAFDWAELAEQTRRREAWFFEHAGTHRAFWLTRRRSLRPRKFWAALKPAWEIDTYRLKFYFITTVLMTAGVYLLLCWGVPAASYGLYQLRLWAWPPRITPTVIRGGTVIISYSRIPPIGYFGYGNHFFDFFLIGAGLMSLILFALTHAFWLVLSFSTQQRAILPRQLFRATTYVLDVLPWLTIVQAIVFWAVWHRDQWPGGLGELIGPGRVVENQIQALSAAVCLVLIAYRMYVVCRRYLGLPHAPAIAMAYVVILGLVWMTAGLYLAVGLPL